MSRKSRRKQDSDNGPATAQADVVDPDNAGRGDAGDLTSASQLETLGLPESVVAFARRLETERDEAREGRMRALADFTNFQRRSTENEARALTTGAANAIRPIMSVLDNFDLALGQDLSNLTMDQFVAGVQLVHDELFKTLESLGVSKIEPIPGEDFDPNLHEAMFRQPAEGMPENTVVTILQSGYALGDLVLRPAKVAVASGE